MAHTHRHLGILVYSLMLHNPSQLHYTDPPLEHAVTELARKISHLIDFKASENLFEANMRADSISWMLCNESQDTSFN